MVRLRACMQVVDGIIESACIVAGVITGDYHAGVA